MKRPQKGIVAALVLWPGLAFATGDVSQVELDDYEGLWSIGLSHRTGTSPYVGQTSRTDLLPMISYSGERFSLPAPRVASTCGAPRNPAWIWC
jgi:hypothetical protein